MTEYNCGEIVQYIPLEGQWTDVRFVGTLSTGQLVIENIDGSTYYTSEIYIRRKPKPQSICVMVYRDPHSVKPHQIYSLLFDTEGAGRVYAFERMLDVIKYITMEIPE